MTRSTDAEIADLDATALAAKLRARELSAIEVAESAVRRMEAIEPRLHAFCTPTPDIAHETARAIDIRLADGEDAGPLAGVPIAVKDLVAVRGIRMAMGSMLYHDFVPEEDDVVVERLHAAGAVLLGKTNVPEFGYSGAGHNPIFPTTRNPWNPALTPGGSSAGSAAAVAARMAPLAVGSDGGGSVRAPAAFSGLVGVKPSMGRVPLYPGCRDERHPGLSSWEGLEHIGPMTRSVRDAALMLSVIAGPDPRDRRSIPCNDVAWTGFGPEAAAESLRGRRIAYSPDWGYAAVDPEIRRVVADAVRVFETDLGCAVEEAHPGWDDPLGAFWALVAMESDLTGMRAMVAGRRHEVSPHLLDFLDRPWTAEQFTAAVMARKAVVNRMWRFMQRYDLLLTPTVATPAFPVDIQGVEMIDGRMVAPAQFLCFTFPMNMTGQPAVSVPAGFTEAGLPVGLQIVGRHLADRDVLEAAMAFEAARPWAGRRPPLLAELGV